jgi:hypothetical protein
MILPDLVIPSLIDQSFLTDAIDSPEQCFDKKHYAAYPWDVSYNYNSRGFRDLEWPESYYDMTNAVWCVGDSFTVGIGSAYEHTWPCVLQKVTGQRTINISMTGASNNWISRRACQILKDIQPGLMIIHWSYDHRREIDNQVIDHKINQYWKKFYTDCADNTWPGLNGLTVLPTIDQFDNLPIKIQRELQSPHNFDFHKQQWQQLGTDVQRRIWHANSTDDENNRNLLDCVNQVELCKNNCTVIHSVIPQYTSAENADTSWTMLKPYEFIPKFDILDLARDGKHYDVKTSEFFVQQIIQCLKTKYQVNLAEHTTVC